jgi:hypothetical protein
VALEPAISVYETDPNQGPAKEIDGPPGAFFLEIQTHPPTYQFICSCVFICFSARGVQKHHEHIFTKQP